MRLDLPTFDLPIKAYSGLLSSGHLETVGADIVNSEFLIIIIAKYLVTKILKSKQ